MVAARSRKLSEQPMKAVACQIACLSLPRVAGEDSLLAKTFGVRSSASRRVRLRRIAVYRAARDHEAVVRFQSLWFIAAHVVDEQTREETDASN